MRAWSPWLFAAFGAVLLLPAALATFVWSTMPPALDPDALPSRELEPPSGAYRDAVEQGRVLARAIVAEEKLPGLSLAVGVDAEIVWAEGFRWADVERETPVTPATLFRMGSVTEVLTAAAVGLLSERGALDLDAPVQRYVPSFPEKAWPISTRQLLAHSAGALPHRVEGGIFLGGHCEDDAERVALFADEPLHFRPDSESRYSTYGLSLVGAAIAGAAGESCLAFLQREVLAELGMEDTVPDVAGQAEDRRARFYHPRLMLDPRYGVEEAPPVFLSCHLHALGFLSSPSDLVRFASSMMGGELLDRATVDELQRPVSMDSGEVGDQALGWKVRRVPLGADGAPTRVVGQGLGEVVRRGVFGAATVGGQVAGGTATLLMVPERGIAVAVMANVTGSDGVRRLSRELADVFVHFAETR